MENEDPEYSHLKGYFESVAAVEIPEAWTNLKAKLERLSELINTNKGVSINIVKLY